MAIKFLLVALLGILSIQASVNAKHIQIKHEEGLQYGTVEECIAEQKEAFLKLLVDVRDEINKCREQFPSNDDYIMCVEQVFSVFFVNEVERINDEIRKCIDKGGSFGINSVYCNYAECWKHMITEMHQLIIDTIIAIKECQDDESCKEKEVNKFKEEVIEIGKWFKSCLEEN